MATTQKLKSSFPYRMGVCSWEMERKESLEIHNHASYDDPNEPVIDYYLGSKMASQLHNAAKESIAIS